MRNLRVPLAAAALAVSGACAGVPFDAVERVPVGDVDAETVRARFADAAPRAFELLNTVVFSFRGSEISAMGAVAADTDRRDFHLACMTPVGVKLFEVSGTPQGVRCDFSLEGFLDEYADDDRLAAAVGGDVRAIYFDVVPSPAARVERTSDAIVFSETTAAGRVELEFAGRDLLLVEKRCTDADGETTRIRYYDYAWSASRAYARGIVLDNGRYGYRLVVRVKEILDSAAEEP